ncbi:FAD/FMN-containing dehydrogenase [Cupriavidus sp. YR651]|uniref:FAD-binding oxidoreductase n=1 Tax=Cupriavidus sp. YR651 TaxID=1855315 RepID=UPI0008902302|nr:FAD-binding oxidoreductase [Cupriavidus sp. YR651]SDD46347.1 FAD/FMN-containing dehydrogenase [Cupriavidus sp. YR651]
MEGALSETVATALKAHFRGQLIQPGDAAYDQARAVYNGMIDKRPALIARCTDVADVIAAVNAARDSGMLLAVRGGAHNGAGLGTCDGGLVVDLSPMKGVFVDPKRNTIRVGGGCTWGDVDHAASAYGMATPSGFISTTGVGGLTLGGGIGYLSRACGLTIDNLLGAEVVLADGRLVNASSDENADLFWALRGGGGNFGVVTSFEFKAHAVGTVYGGPMLWPMDQARELMKWWRDFILTAPEDINGWFGFVTVPPGPPFPESVHLQKMCAVVWCYTGPLDQAEARFKPIRDAMPPAVDFAGPIPWPVLQSLFDALYPPGLQWYWKADFVTDLSDKAIDLHIKYGHQLPSMHSTMHLYPINGAAHRAGPNDTAFSYRDANFASVIVGVDPDPTNNDRIVQWAKDYWLALHPHSAGGGYINMMMDEGNDNVKAAYRDNYAQLAEIKRKYDPANLFRVNQNIRPA